MSEQPARWRRLGPASVVILASLLVCTACSSEADRLDAEAQRLCAIDGGIKVYETVVLPPDKFNEFGQALVPLGKDDRGWGYYVKSEEKRLSGKDGTPQLIRFVETVFRVSDAKTLATSVSYMTGGGEFLRGLIQHQLKVCPPLADRRLADRVFIKESAP
jgi:hypothetical protein